MRRALAISTPTFENAAFASFIFATVAVPSARGFGNTFSDTSVMLPSIT